MAQTSQYQEVKDKSVLKGGQTAEINILGTVEQYSLKQKFVSVSFFLNVCYAHELYSRSDLPGQRHPSYILTGWYSVMILMRSLYSAILKSTLTTVSFVNQ